MSTREPRIAAERALIDKGIELRKAEDDRGARAAFDEAWKLGGSPEALAQLALAEQAIGLWLEAHEHLALALTHGQDSWIVRHRAVLDAALAEMESRFGRLEVSCNVSGADVSMDGRSVGRTPFTSPLYLLAGASVVRVSADGYFDVTRQVQIDAGALSRLVITLTPSSTPASPAAGARPPLALEGSSSARHLLEYGSLGLAALGLAVGVTGYGLREANVRDYNDDSRCGVEPGRRRSEECPAEAAAWRLGEGLAIGGFAAAGVFGALGVYLWVVDPSDPDPSAHACAFGLGSVVCGARF